MEHAVVIAVEDALAVGLHDGLVVLAGHGVVVADDGGGGIHGHGGLGVDVVAEVVYHNAHLIARYGLLQGGAGAGDVQAPEDAVVV